MSGNIAKISVEKHENREQFLYELDKALTLDEIVKDICSKAGLPPSSVYGLKLISTKDDPFIRNYVTNTSYKEIEHMATLKICFSIRYLLNSRILPHVSKGAHYPRNEEEEEEEREIAFETLLELATDPAFIDELAQSGSDEAIVSHYVRCADRAIGTELLALLVTICHLLREGRISVDASTRELCERTIEVLRRERDRPDYGEDINAEHVKYALSILHKILVQRDESFSQWKLKILEDLPVTALLPYLRPPRSTPSLRYGALLLINTYIRVGGAERRSQAIRVMNQRSNREAVFKYVIEGEGGDRANGEELDSGTRHEVYVLQTYLMSMYKDALNSEMNLNDNNIVKREDFELCDDEVRRMTFLMDFEDQHEYHLANGNRSDSVEDLFSGGAETRGLRGERYSLASIISDKSSQMGSSRFSSRQTSLCCDYDNPTINYLTLEALKYYKKHHSKIFHQSQIEEKVYEPGIFVTSEKVIKIIAKLLHIGKEVPDSKSLLYQPLIFSCTSKTPFILELFSRSMWLLSRTRREMRVKTIEDYPKVMNVLHKQIKMVLEKQPKDFKVLTSEMTEVTLDVVMRQWQKEKNEEMDNLLRNHPSVQELKLVFMTKNELLIRENRLALLKKGANFPKVLEKKTSGSIFVQLSKNERKLIVHDDTATSGKTKRKEICQRNISEITHIAIGQNCKHHTLCKDPSLAFSVIFQNSQNQINFIAKDQKSASHWIDAFNILTGFNRRSDYYNADLHELTEMDLKLKLIELQNVRIPKNRPEIPNKLPNELRPPVPPKPEILKKRLWNLKI